MRIVERPVKPWLRILQSPLIPVAILVQLDLAERARIIPPGSIPHPSRVAQGGWIWAFGPTGMGLNPCSGAWASNVLNSATRVAQGHVLRVLLASLWAS